MTPPTLKLQLPLDQLVAFHIVKGGVQIELPVDTVKNMVIIISRFLTEQENATKSL